MNQDAEVSMENSGEVKVDNSPRHKNNVRSKGKSQNKKILDNNSSLLTQNQQQDH